MIILENVTANHVHQNMDIVLNLVNIFENMMAFTIREL